MGGQRTVHEITQYPTWLHDHEEPLINEGIQYPTWLGGKPNL